LLRQHKFALHAIKIEPYFLFSSLFGNFNLSHTFFRKAGSNFLRKVLYFFQKNFSGVWRVFYHNISAQGSNGVRGRSMVCARIALYLQ